MSLATRVLFPLLATTSLLVGTSAQSPTAPLTPATSAPASRPATTFVLEAGEIKLTDLIDRAAAFLEWNILVNPMELQSAAPSATTFKLHRRIEADHQGCQELLTTLLSSSGFAVTPLNESKQLYEVVSMNGPRNREVLNRAAQRSPDEVLAHPELRLPVLTVVQLQHTNATVAQNALRPFFASTGSPGGGNSITIGGVGNNTAIVLCGMQDQVANVIRMLRIVDVPPPKELQVSLGDRVESLQERVAKLEQALAKLTEKTAEKR